MSLDSVILVTADAGFASSERRPVCCPRALLVQIPTRDISHCIVPLHEYESLPDPREARILLVFCLRLSCLFVSYSFQLVPYWLSFVFWSMAFVQALARVTASSGLDPAPTPSEGKAWALQPNEPVLVGGLLLVPAPVSPPPRMCPILVTVPLLLLAYTLLVR
jgi:hypothetical protein